MKLYKEGGLTVYCAKELRLNRHQTGVLSKKGDGTIHMDIYQNGKGPTGTTVEFGPKLLDGVLDLFK
ncbi:hypothetical protein FACS1894140_4980 [Spirochaetia bacterium]|nr:hypothetical protein FACS1894140_4980 [Spirochaetia bacterium]